MEMQSMKQEIKQLTEKVDYLSSINIPQTLSLKFGDRTAVFRFESMHGNSYNFFISNIMSSEYGPN